MSFSFHTYQLSTHNSHKDSRETDLWKNVVFSCVRSSKKGRRQVHIPIQTFNINVHHWFAATLNYIFHQYMYVFCVTVRLSLYENPQPQQQKRTDEEDLWTTTKKKEVKSWVCMQLRFFKIIIISVRPHVCKINS